MARTGRFHLGRVSLVQLADMVDRARELGYTPNARVDVVLEVSDPNARGDVVLEVRDPNAREHPRGSRAAGSTR